MHRMKHCTTCHELKNLSDFYMRKDKYKDRYRSQCKSCMHSKGKEWVNNNKQKWKKYRKEHHIINKEYDNLRSSIYYEIKDKYRKRELEFGVNKEQYLLMLQNQNYRCDICEIHQNQVNLGFAVDHDHNTGKIRSLLCSVCNLRLGTYKDSPKLLLKNNKIKEANYLIKHGKCLND